MNVVLVAFAAISVAALLGWSLTLVLVLRASKPVFDSFFALVKLNEYEDRKISAAIARYEQLRERSQPQRPGMPQAPQQPQRNAAVDALNEVLGAGAVEPIGEQPDLEVYAP